MSERGTCQDMEKTRLSKVHSRSVETAEEGICQETEKNRPSKEHSPTGDNRGMDLSAHGEKQTERGALTVLTSWRRQREREGLVRTQKETD